MKARPFTIPKIDTESFSFHEDYQKYFYDHLHTHPEIQVTYIISSRGSRFIGTSIDCFKPGEIYIVGSNIPHMFKNDPEYYEDSRPGFAHSMSVFIRQDIFTNIFSKTPELVKIMDLISLSSSGIKLSAKSTSVYHDLFFELNELKSFERFIKILNLLNTLANDPTLQPLTHFGLPPQTNSEKGDRLNKVIAYITQNYTHKITVEHIARIANLTSPAFCRYFKLHTRKSFVTFLNEFRIGMACKLLLEKEKNISEVCYQTGFNNISNFNRQFKAITGFTPSNYIKQGL